MYDNINNTFTFGNGSAQADPYSAIGSSNEAVTGKKPELDEKTILDLVPQYQLKIEEILKDLFNESLPYREQMTSMYGYSSVLKDDPFHFGMLCGSEELPLLQVINGGMVAFCMVGPFVASQNNVKNTNAVVDMLNERISYDIDMMSCLAAAYQLDDRHLRAFVLLLVGHERRHAIQTPEQFTSTISEGMDALEAGHIHQYQQLAHELDANIHGWNFMLENI